MNSNKYRNVLFAIFTIIFVLTAGLALVGVCISWYKPDVELPYLGKLITITIVEICAGIVLLFYRVFGLRKQRDSYQLSRIDYQASIKDCFVLFKYCLEACLKQSVNFRLHFMRYDITDEKVAMVVQDDTYEDKNFVIDLKEGCDEGVVVCNAISTGAFQIVKLPSDHMVKYPKSQIRKTLKAVMAFPVRHSGKIIGVVSLDSDEEFTKLGIGEDNLKKIFLKLCQIIEDIINNVRMDEK